MGLPQYPVVANGDELRAGQSDFLQGTRDALVIPGTRLCQHPGLALAVDERYAGPLLQGSEVSAHHRMVQAQGHSGTTDAPQTAYCLKCCSECIRNFGRRTSRSMFRPSGASCWRQSR